MKLLRAVPVLAALGFCVAVQPADAAPTRAASAEAKSAPTKRIAKLPKLKMKLGKLSATPPMGAFQVSKGVKFKPITFLANKVELSAQHPIDGSAFMLAYEADVMPTQTQGFIPRGVHVRPDGAFSSIVTRQWVGTHDLLVECTGALPDSVAVQAYVTRDNGFFTAGMMTVGESNGRVKFVVMTSDIETDTNHIMIAMRHDGDPTGFRVDECTIERL